MTRKDYIILAATARDMLLINMPTQEYLNGATHAKYSIALRLCEALGRDNPRFDRARFLEACGVQQ